MCLEDIKVRVAHNYHIVEIPLILVLLLADIPVLGICVRLEQITCTCACGIAKCVKCFLVMVHLVIYQYQVSMLLNVGRLYH